MKYFSSVLCATVLLMSASLHAEPANKKVLIIVSNRVDMGDPEKHDARNNLLEVAPHTMSF